MVAPGGGVVHGMKTTDGRMGPLGKFFLPFWGVRWEDGRKTVWFSGEKPGETGRNNGESHRGFPRAARRLHGKICKWNCKKIRDRRRWLDLGGKGRTTDGGPGSRREFPAI